MKYNTLQSLTYLYTEPMNIRTLRRRNTRVLTKKNFASFVKKNYSNVLKATGVAAVATLAAKIGYHPVMQMLQSVIDKPFQNAWKRIIRETDANNGIVPENVSYLSKYFHNVVHYNQNFANVGKERVKIPVMNPTSFSLFIQLVLKRVKSVLSFNANKLFFELKKNEKHCVSMTFEYRASKIDTVTLQLVNMNDLRTLERLVTVRRFDKFIKKHK